MLLSYLGLSGGSVNADRLPVAVAGGDDLRVFGLDESGSKTAARSSMIQSIALLRPLPERRSAARGKCLETDPFSAFSQLW
jgi:hypothetical protein